MAFATTHLGEVLIGNGRKITNLALGHVAQQDHGPQLPTWMSTYEENNYSPGNCYCRVTDDCIRDHVSST